MAPGPTLRLKLLLGLAFTCQSLAFLNIGPHIYESFRRATLGAASCTEIEQKSPVGVTGDTNRQYFAGLLRLPFDGRSQQSLSFLLFG